MITTTRLPLTQCPHRACGGPLDLALSPRGRTPGVGSLAACKWCSGAIRIGEGLCLEALADSELTPQDVRKLEIGRQMLLEHLGPAPRAWPGKGAGT